LPLLVMTEKGAVQVAEAERKLDAQPGDRVLWFGCKDVCTPRLQPREAAGEHREAAAGPDFSGNGRGKSGADGATGLSDDRSGKTPDRRMAQKGRVL
jgi:hypothetical protein